MKLNLQTTQLAATLYGVLLIFISSIAMADKLDYLMPGVVPAPQNNQTTAERVALGKALFFDPRLSGSNWISCATCHNPLLGWSDGLATGIGHDMQKLNRATPTILNSAYSQFLFWDGRARSLEEQALGPIQSSKEMNQDLESLVAELEAIEGYRQLFAAAYPDEGINKKTIGKAIAAFERTIISTESPFDKWLHGDGTAISDSAKRGFELFEGKARCAVCHFGFNFTDDGFHNTGIAASNDQGRYRIRKIAMMRGAFKTPTLRDITLTAPYMHNGIYTTLEEVIKHYNRGGDERKHLSPNIQPLNLSKQEMADLLAFLETLTSIKPAQITLPQLPQ